MNIEHYNKPRSEWERLIDEWIFNERDRKILKRKLLDGITHERVAEEFDMSVRRIKVIVKKGDVVEFFGPNLDAFEYTFTTSPNTYYLDIRNNDLYDMEIEEIYKANIRIQNPNAPIFGKGGRL